MSQIFNNISSNRVTNIQVKQDLASFATKSYVKERNYWYLTKPDDFASIRSEVDSLKVLVVSILLWCFHSRFGLLMMVSKRLKNVLVLVTYVTFN